jgi:DNA-binding transcriptional regulator GbsR (MarR family)
MPALKPAREKFIIMWGEMAARCATTRTAGRVHGLLLTSPEPLNADEIREHLGISRSNISTALHELEGWKLIRVVHVIGDRRDYFEPVRHLWEAFQNVIGEQHRRLFDPFRNELNHHLSAASHPTDGDQHTADCIRQLVEFCEVLAQWIAEVKATHPRKLHELKVERANGDHHVETPRPAVHSIRQR